MAGGADRVGESEKAFELQKITNEKLLTNSKLKLQLAQIKATADKADTPQAQLSRATERVDSYFDKWWELAVANKRVVPGEKGDIRQTHIESFLEGPGAKAASDKLAAIMGKSPLHGRVPFKSLVEIKSEENKAKEEQLKLLQDQEDKENKKGFVKTILNAISKPDFAERAISEGLVTREESQRTIVDQLTPQTPKFGPARNRPLTVEEITKQLSGQGR